MANHTRISADTIQTAIAHGKAELTSREAFAQSLNDAISLLAQDIKALSSPIKKLGHAANSDAAKSLSPSERKRAYISLRTIQIIHEQGRLDELVEHARNLYSEFGTSEDGGKSIYKRHSIGDRTIHQKERTYYGIEAATASAFNQATAEYILLIKPEAQITNTLRSRRHVMGAIIGGVIGVGAGNHWGRNGSSEGTHTRTQESQQSLSQRSFVEISNLITNKAVSGVGGAICGFAIGDFLNSVKLNDNFRKYANLRGDIEYSFDRLLNYAHALGTAQQTAQGASR